MPKFGTVEKNRILYDGERLYNQNKSGDCALYISDGDLKFSFGHKKGRLVGFEGRIGELENIRSGTVDLPQFFDGDVYARSSLKFIKGANYFTNISKNAVYDRERNYILLGYTDNEQIVVRIAENLYVLISGDKIYGIIISL